jgi:hypothetical protein
MDWRIERVPPAIRASSAQRVVTSPNVLASAIRRFRRCFS